MPETALPPWEGQSADPASFWLKGMQVGSSIQEARNKLKLQADQTNLETALAQKKAADQMQLQQLELEQKSQQAQQTLHYHQQQLEQQQQFRQATMGIQEAKLKQAQEKIGLETQKAGQAFIAQRAYQDQVQQLMDSGMDEGEASMTAMMRTAGLMKTSGAGVAALAKGITQSQLPQGLGQPQFYKDPNSGASLAVGPKGHMIRTDTGMGKAPNAVWAQKHEITRAEKTLDGLIKEHLADDLGAAAAKSKDTSPEAVKNRKIYQSRASDIQMLQNQIKEKTQQLMSAPQTNAAPAPDPWDEEQDTGEWETPTAGSAQPSASPKILSIKIQ